MAAIKGHTKIALLFISLGDKTCLNDPNKLPSVHQEAMCKFQAIVRPDTSFGIDAGLFANIKATRETFLKQSNPVEVELSTKDIWTW
jgi:hypothetical protein